jgi:hypothetical protein
VGAEAGHAGYGLLFQRFPAFEFRRHAERVADEETEDGGAGGGGRVVAGGCCMIKGKK